MKFFLRAKAWQLFLLLMGMFFIQPFIIGMLPSPIIGFSLFMAIFMLLLTGWLWSIGITANNRLPPHLKKSASLYSGGMLFALLYSSSFGFAVSAPIEILVYLIPLHLASMFFMFYALWFTAKQFTTLQNREKVTFFEYSGPFFMLWLFPIGVWFIQPIINKQLGEDAQQLTANGDQT